MELGGLKIRMILRVEKCGFGEIGEGGEFGRWEKWIWSWFELIDSLERLLGTPTGKWVTRIQWNG